VVPVTDGSRSSRLGLLQELLASLPVAVAYLAAPSLVIEFANDRFRELSGRQDLAGRPAREVLPELPGRGWLGMLERVLRTGEPARGTAAGVRVRRHGRGGQVVAGYVLQPVRDASGAVTGVAVCVTDVTSHARTEAHLRAISGMLERLRDADVIPVAMAGVDRVHEANDAFLGLLGYTRDDLAAGRLTHQAITPPEQAGRDRETLRRLRRMGALEPRYHEYRHRDGRRIPVLAGMTVASSRPFRWVSFALDLTARDRAERERTGTLVREQRARAEAEQASGQLSLLLRAGSLAAAATDRQQLLQQVAGLVVPVLADFCMILLPAGEGRLRAATVTHRDPARAVILGRLYEEPFSATGPLPSQQAYTRNETQLVTDAGAGMPGWAGAEPWVAGVVERIQPASSVAVPLTAGGQRLGVIVLGRGSGRPRFTGTDRQVIEELARRLAAALGAASMLSVEHMIAESLQRSLLPPLPDVPGLDLAARYLPATSGADVGGDWYDVFGLRDGRVALVIGDTAGHSIASAAVMGQIRSMVRAYAINVPDPMVVLRRTASAVAELLPDVLASVACAMLDVTSGVFAYASAGHPPLLMTEPGGHTEYLTAASGIMLGAAADPRILPGRRRLAPGGTLFLYTDGLVESRDRELGEGMAALAGALRGHPGRSAEETCATAVQALLGTGTALSDDVCLLAVRRLG
jgi:PAS domain S-box-containing protein